MSLLWWLLLLKFSVIQRQLPSRNLACILCYDLRHFHYGFSKFGCCFGIKKHTIYTYKYTSVYRHYPVSDMFQDQEVRFVDQRIINLPAFPLPLSLLLLFPRPVLETGSNFRGSFVLGVSVLSQCKDSHSSSSFFKRMDFHSPCNRLLLRGHRNF